ncbi:MAG: pantoate--beta-alanine ligase [Endomicrobiaceae bacterium]|nr:pantoate--beta-alanine ligase [Endomicrobiaceae bacterium]
MKIIRKPEELQKAIEVLKKKGKTVGLVPTMGALHCGHISLMKKSVSQNDITVVSVYVNPIQFGPNEDYEKYPRPVEKDIKVCKDNKVDFLFLPTNQTLYNDNFSTYIYNNKLAKIMCGVTRPIHFQGVCTVVSKLFNIAMPTRAYFGLKDYQQYIIVKQMAKDLNFNIKVIGCPIVREKSGLAMSSRNTYLSEQDKQNACGIYKSLSSAKKQFSEGKKLKDIKKNIEKNILSIPESKIDYVELRNSENLNEVTDKDKSIVIAVAVKVGNVRLIDNIVCKK